MQSAQAINELRKKKTKVIRVGTESGEHYQPWLFALRATAELLFQANHDDQSLYADIALPEEWQGDAITIWCGPSPEEMTPRLRIGDMDALWVWDGRFDMNSPEAQSAWDELWPEAAQEPLTATVRRLAARAGVRLNTWSSELPKARFAFWARIFCAVVDCLPLLSKRQQWVVSTSYNSGWGTYYLHFQTLEGCGRYGFALSEEGHLALLPDGTDEDVKAFNIRHAIERGLPIEALAAILLPPLQHCAETAEASSGEI